MGRFLIIADDFTGANDTGVQFTKRGIATEVIFNGSISENNEQAIVIDTESRGMDGKEAYEHVKELCKAILTGSFSCVYKKIDSTLRGNIQEEIKALDDIYQPELIIFAPAYPSNHRITKQGVQYMNNLPVSQTEVGSDPKKPVTEDNITKLLQSGFEEEVSHISLETIRNENMDLTEKRIFTFDAVENEDLIKIVDKVNNLNKKTLWIGSAGLADAIMQVNIPAKPVLCVVGSISDVSNTQVYFSETKGTKVVRINVAELLQKNNQFYVIEEAVRELRQDQDTIIVSSYTRVEYEQCIQAGNELGMTKEQVCLFTQAALGQVVKEILKEVNVAGLFLTGGDTSIEVIRSLEAKGSKILREITTGIPLMRLQGGLCDGLAVITKAGAFGETNALDYCIRRLKEAL